MSTAWLWSLGHLPGWLLLAAHVAPSGLLRRPRAAAPAPRAGLAPRLGRGHHRRPGRRDARLRALRRDQHRPPPHRPLQARDGAAALLRGDRAGTRARPRPRPTRAALQAAVPRRRVDLRLPRRRRQPRPAARRLRRRHRPHRRRHRRRPRPRPHLLLHLARRQQRPEGRRRPEARRRARRHLPGDGRRPRQPRHGPLRALGGDGGGRRPPRRGAADRLPAVAPAQGPDRHAQPPQDRGDRQPRHLLRLEQLRRRRLRDQAALRALGRRDDALRGPDRAAEPARLRHRLDGAHQGGPERRSSPSRSRRSATGFPAQVIATGATVRYSAMPEMFEVADVRRAPRARRHHPLLRPRRADPGRALRQRPARRRHHRRASRRGTTAGSSPPPATATTPSCSTPA